LADGTPVQLDGETPPRPALDKPLREMTIAEAVEALAPEPANGPAQSNPAVVIGGGIMPAPLLAAKVAATATIRPLIHPGDAPPEPRYVPSRKLADFVRCRDLTCRFPGCDEPAFRCDLDHTIPYPAGPTCASIWRAYAENTGCTSAYGRRSEFRRNPPLRRSDGEEMPVAGQALELVCAAVFELKS
jgi:hypothetical protein